MKYIQKFMMMLTLTIENLTDERLNDIVGSAYYVAPEVLHRSYGTEADMWSIGVIAYILLCGSRPFWSRTESGIFRAVLKTDPSFDEAPWPNLSPDALDFVKRLLNKDYRKRLTAAQALSMYICAQSLQVFHQLIFITRKSDAKIVAWVIYKFLITKLNDLMISFLRSSMAGWTS